MIKRKNNTPVNEKHISVLEMAKSLLMKKFRFV